MYMFETPSMGSILWYALFIALLYFLDLKAEVEWIMNKSAEASKVYLKK